MNMPSVAVAFGGGGARGLAHIHVIRALEDLGIKPVAISGTSIGSIMGGGVAAGMTADEIENHVVETFSDKLEVLGRLWSMRPSSVSDFINGPKSMLGNIDAQKAVKAFLPDQVPGTFEELNLPFQVVATDFYGQCEHVFSSGDLNKAIGASSALPAVFRPVRHEGKALVDGGIQNSVPYELLLGKADIVVAIDVVGGPKPDAKGGAGPREPSRIEALAGASQLMMQAATRLKMRIYQPDVMILPPVNGIGVMDFLKAGQILKDTASTYDQARREIEGALKNFQGSSI